MRYILFVALFCGLLGAQDNAALSRSSSQGNGTFYVNGIAYHFLSGTDYTVVVAAHSIANRKFLAVKLRVVNNGQHSVTVRPDDVRVADAVADHDLEGIPGAELAKRMRRPYNWSRFAVNAAGGPPSDTGDDSQTPDQQHNDILRAMQQMAVQMASAPPVISALSIADTTGLRQPEPGMVPEATISDEVSHLRMKEASHPDVLMQLQRQISPDYLEGTALLANSIPPRADLEGVFYYPMGKLVRDPAASKKSSRSGIVRVTVPVGDEHFQFKFPVE